MIRFLQPACYASIVNNRLKAIPKFDVKSDQAALTKHEGVNLLHTYSQSKIDFHNL